jgi:N-acetylmuramoyl-L-alanine amidase
MKINAVFIAALLSLSSFAASGAEKSVLLQKAHEAYVAAQALEATLNEKPEADRTRAEYLKVINAYQRTYLITPATRYADDALSSVARLYEEMKDNADAIKTLQFLIHEYPGTPFKDAAEKDIARLSGVTTAQTAQTQKTTSVDNLRYWETPHSVRVVVNTSGEVRFAQGEAKGPDRVFVDVTPAHLNSAMIGKQLLVKSGLLQQIRLGQYDASTVRIVLYVGTIGRVTSFTLRDPDRLIIDVLGKDAPITADPTATPVESVAAAPTPVTTAPASAATATTTPETPKVAAKPAATPGGTTKKSPEKPDTKPADTKSAAAAAATANPPAAPSAGTAPATSPSAEAKVIVPAKATSEGTRSLVRSLGLKLQRVVIDAGHGGHDTGTIGPGGYTEKELVLDVATRLKTLIETEMGAEVVMTRTDDSFIPLESRTVIANQQQADLFISIHANSSQERSVHGVETYYLNFTSSREGLETASRENAASERSIHELQDLVKKIMLRDKLDESRELAEHIEHALAARKGSGVDRGVKQAPFVVLIGANMPSILAEICFISNPQDEKSVKKPDGRQAIADSLFEGVKSYAESLSGTKSAKVQDKTN